MFFKFLADLLNDDCAEVESLHFKPMKGGLIGGSETHLIIGHLDEDLFFFSFLNYYYLKESYLLLKRLF